MTQFHHQIAQKIEKISGYPIIVGLIIFLTLSALLGCANGPVERMTPAIPITSSPIPTTPLPAETPPITHEPLYSSSGPYLLIQNDLTQYQIIDLATKHISSFDPPSTDSQYNLSRNQSPTRQLIFFPLDDDKISITDLSTGKVSDKHILSNEETEFNADMAVKEALTLFEEDRYAVESLKAMIDDAHRKSLSDIRWYKNDQYWLLPRESNQTSTNLTLYDLESRSFLSLENQPGLVLDYWVGPDKDQILLKKGYINQPDLWEGFRYYVLEVNSSNIKAIPLLDFIDNPTLFWLQNETIGIIHQMAPIGGIDFSIYNLNSGETKQIVKGAFTHISLYSENLFWIKDSPIDQMTTVGISTFQAETLHQQAINQHCSYKTRLDNLILLNCEGNSLFLNENLEIIPFGPSVSLLVPASQSEIAILITRNEEVYLLYQKTLEREPLDLEGTPLEIRWLPDGSGFLYRISGKIFVYLLKTQESNLLLTSGFFTDYSNINAVWIKVN